MSPNQAPLCFAHPIQNPTTALPQAQDIWAVGVEEDILVGVVISVGVEEDIPVGAVISAEDIAAASRSERTPHLTS